MKNSAFSLEREKPESCSIGCYKRNFDPLLLCFVRKTILKKQFSYIFSSDRSVRVKASGPALVLVVHVRYLRSYRKLVIVIIIFWLY